MKKDEISNALWSTSLVARGGWWAACISSMGSYSNDCWHLWYIFGRCWVGLVGYVGPMESFLILLDGLMTWYPTSLQLLYEVIPKVGGIDGPPECGYSTVQSWIVKLFFCLVLSRFLENSLHLLAWN